MIAVDAVVVSIEPDGSGGCRPLVLTVRRRKDPFEGHRSLPGVLVSPDEELEAAARRALGSAAGLQDVRHLEQLATFGEPGRDPRGRIVTVAYLGLLPAPTATTGGAEWQPLAEPVPLAFDHAEILEVALDRLRGKLTYSNVAYGLLPDTFTLTELQAVYEAVLGTELDKRNFRKKFLAAGVLDEAPGKRRGPHRPAQLYRFSSQELTLLDTVITGVGP